MKGGTRRYLEIFKKVPKPSVIPNSCSGYHKEWEKIGGGIKRPTRKLSEPVSENQEKSIDTARRWDLDSEEDWEGNGNDFGIIGNNFDWALEISPYYG